jgi:predicted ABC-type ATPase
VTLIFLWLNDPDLAIRRVAQRVAEGGHSIPHDVIVRRYWAGLRNLIALYLPLADTAQIYDNSGSMGVPVANKTREAGLVIDDRSRWARLKGAVNERPDRS